MNAVSNHVLYPIWQEMKRRCYAVNHPAYGRYGGRGISVCDRWRNDFWAFVEDLGPRPLGFTLERKDNDGNYEPENCRWATWSEQHANKSNSSAPISFQGTTRTASQWASHLGLTTDALRARLKAGWSLERALTTSNLESTPELRRLNASKAGKSIPPQKRTFSTNRELARRAGRAGGLA